MNNIKKGFTLIELLIVVAIIGIQTHLDKNHPSSHINTDFQIMLVVYSLLCI